jgi:hypothetical protein
MNIVVSHSAKDLDLIGPFVDFLRLAGGAGEGDIFCTSALGSPNGEYFVREILRRLTKADLTIVVLTTDYFSCQFCLAVVGAAQFRRHVEPDRRGEFFSLVVPPLTQDKLRGVLNGLQSGEIDNKEDLNELFEILLKLGSAASMEGWEAARDSFLTKIAGPLDQRKTEDLLKLTVLDARYERLTDGYVRKNRNGYARKFCIILRNDTGHQLQLRRAIWHTEAGDAFADPRDWWGFQSLTDNGTWTEEIKTLEVEHNQSFRVGIALENKLSHQDMEQRQPNQNLGVVEIEVLMSGQKLKYRRRF